MSSNQSITLDLSRFRGVHFNTDKGHFNCNYANYVLLNRNADDVTKIGLNIDHCISMRRKVFDKPILNLFATTILLSIFILQSHGKFDPLEPMATGDTETFYIDSTKKIADVGRRCLVNANTYKVRKTKQNGNQSVLWIIKLVEKLVGEYIENQSIFYYKYKNRAR